VNASAALERAPAAVARQSLDAIAAILNASAALPIAKTE